ncbi:hypothetical protein OROHE_005564 [Orobanche hederae]
MIVLTSARFFDCSANESAKLVVHSPVKETAVNVDVAVRELPHANTKSLKGCSSKAHRKNSPSWSAIQKAKCYFDINARGCAVYTSINVDKKAFQLHARRTVYEHRLVSPGNAIGLSSSTTVESVDLSEQERINANFRLHGSA